MIPPWPRWTPIFEDSADPRWFHQGTHYQGWFYRLSWRRVVDLQHGHYFLDRASGPDLTDFVEVLVGHLKDADELEAELSDLRAHLPERLMELML